MLGALTLLLACQLAGETLQRLLDLPLPGPVIGLVLLLGLLAIRREVWPALATTARGLLQHLTLLYVPAGVGLMVHLERLSADWLPLLAALVGSTLLTLLVTVFVFRGVSRLTERDRAGGAAGGGR